MGRVRITISITEELANEVDRQVDGMHIRNRSHAIETLLSESLNLSSIKTAVILAGGTKATKRIPAIKQAIEQLHKFGIFKVIVAVGFLGKEIEDSLNTAQNANNTQISYHQSSNGTGGALYELRHKLSRPFFVINIFQPTDIDLKNLIRFHNEHKPVATIATRSLRDLNGVYLFDPAIFDYIPKGFSSLEDEVFVKLTKEGKLLAYPVLA